MARKSSLLGEHRDRGRDASHLLELPDGQRAGRLGLCQGGLPAAPADRPRPRQASGGDRPAPARIRSSEGVSISARLSEEGLVWIVPLVLLALLAVSYLTRPPSRRLTGSPA
jgi:hypothetical protein